jgi:TetR/AcrR family transcriptional repressor of mexCD-oprJ operon
VTATKTRRRADAERSIEVIIKAATELFGKGELPSMSDIARAAGVGRVTLYAHFPSREQLLETVVKRTLATTNAAIDELDLDAKPPTQGLAALVQHTWPILDHSRRLRTTALAQLGTEAVRRLHVQALDHVERLIARGQDDRTFRTDLPCDWLAAAVHAIVHAAADEVDAGRLQPAKAPHVITTTVLSLVRAGQPG